MAAITGTDPLVRKWIEALGLWDNGTISVDIHMKKRDVVTITVHQQIQKEHMASVPDLITEYKLYDPKKYRLVEIEKELT